MQRGSAESKSTLNLFYNILGANVDQSVVSILPDCQKQNTTAFGEHKISCNSQNISLILPFFVLRVYYLLIRLP